MTFKSQMDCMYHNVKGKDLYFYLNTAFFRSTVNKSKVKIQNQAPFK